MSSGKIETRAGVYKGAQSKILFLSGKKKILEIKTFITIFRPKKGRNVQNFKRTPKKFGGLQWCLKLLRVVKGGSTKTEKVFPYTER